MNTSISNNTNPTFKQCYGWINMYRIATFTLLVGIIQKKVEMHISLYLNYWNAWSILCKRYDYNFFRINHALF